MNGYENQQTIGQQIGLLRSEREESQEELGQAIGEARETIKHWENGTRRIKAESIVKLAKHFGVTSDFLLGISTYRRKDYSEMSLADTGIPEEFAADYIKFVSRNGDQAIKSFLSNHHFWTAMSALQSATIFAGLRDRQEILDIAVSPNGDIIDYDALQRLFAPYGIRAAAEQHLYVALDDVVSSFEQNASTNE